MNEKICYIYTDGCCLGNNQKDLSKRFGGYAYVLKYNGHELVKSGGETQTSNNRMELMAVIKALESCKPEFTGKYIVITDSKYVGGAIKEWLANWMSNGWRTANRKPVENKDLWQQYVEISKGKTIEWQWIEGHTGHPENERCDSLAKEAAAKIVSSPVYQTTA